MTVLLVSWITIVLCPLTNSIIAFYRTHGMHFDYRDALAKNAIGCTVRSKYVDKFIHLSWCSCLHRWCLTSWWPRRGCYLGWQIFYYFSQRKLYSPPPIWGSSGQATCWLSLWWWRSDPVAPTLRCVSHPHGWYPSPQHAARPPDHLVDTHSRWFQLPTT